MIEENSQDEHKPKKIEIVKGNSKDLNISNIRDSLIMEKPEEKKKKNIIIRENVDSQDLKEDNSNNN